MKEQPKEITVCLLECVLMPQGEIICLGETIGWFRKFKKYLMKKTRGGVNVLVNNYFYNYSISILFNRLLSRRRTNKGRNVQ